MLAFSFIQNSLSFVINVNATCPTQLLKFYQGTIQFQDSIASNQSKLGFRKLDIGPSSKVNLRYMDIKSCEHKVVLKHNIYPNNFGGKRQNIQNTKHFTFPTKNIILNHKLTNISQYFKNV